MKVEDHKSQKIEDKLYKMNSLWDETAIAFVNSLLVYFPTQDPMRFDTEAHKASPLHKD